ncbi:class I SAM-dependent methyltransferase [Nakamurella sp. YIM 132087]|uniref:Class I SAM-dependent methyltransferase n=1 Tax=Nakamurella alba TaxID=2665158 RepID=A0A7K1FJD1_9ACTN|nr:class I SAM-dependent methyltransferase [Nakamurella alba]
MQDLVLTLQLAAHGDRFGAMVSAALAAEAGSLLGAALEQYLTDPAGDGTVYDAPAAFEAFIRGGGNVGLYQRTSAALAATYRDVRPTTLLEIGCGDGLALLPALDAAGGAAPTSVELVEPSAALLGQCTAALAARDISVTTSGPGTLQDRLDNSDSSWDLAESSFALHALEPTVRTEQLRRLAPRVRRLVLVEFDVHVPEPGTDAHVRELAIRYEKGLAEYTDTRDLVAQGFLAPVLIGQLAPDAPRATWEQPREAWAAQLAEAGFTDITTEDVSPYWWSPAFVLRATGRA